MDLVIQGQAASLICLPSGEASHCCVISWQRGGRERLMTWWEARGMRLIFFFFFGNDSLLEELSLSK